jgi:hypothetical protein
MHKAHFSRSNDDFKGEFGYKIARAFLKNLYELGEKLNENKIILKPLVEKYKLEEEKLNLSIEKLKKTINLELDDKERKAYLNQKVLDLNIEKINLFDTHFFSFFNERFSLSNEIEIIKFIENLV